MRILLGGASGLIGSALNTHLTTAGHDVRRLVRSSPTTTQEILWDPDREVLEPQAVAGIDAVVLLSGYNIAKRRWTPAVKQLIRDSRIKSAALLASTLARLATPPQLFICASAIGYYGNRGDAVCTEDMPPGTGEFLPEVCGQWEAATAPATAAGIATVNLRLGPVLSLDGGMLREVLGFFRWGLGGRVGSGRQWFSWISLVDVVGTIAHLLQTSNVSGPLNVVAPQPVTNAEFTRALAAAVHRPAVLPVPALAIRLRFGQMGEELALSSTRVDCRKLLATGYAFRHPDLASTLQDLLPEG